MHVVVIRRRRFNVADKLLPDGLTLAERFTTLSPHEKRFVSQIQGRTYANTFGLVERFINAKVLELCGEYVLGDQVALEAMVRFSDEELKHQALFRRIEAMMGEVLPDGYHFDFVPESVARAVLGKSTWAVLLLTLDIELFTQLHYRQSIDPDTQLSTLFKDVFLYHWKEESQHAILDELELMRVDAASTSEERDRGVDDLFELIGRVRSEPATGKTKWRVATTWQGQTRSRAEVEGFGIGGELVRRPFSIDIDEPLELGGSNRFANPQEHLIAALNACMTVGYVAQCAVRGITLESLAIETEGEIDLRGFLGIDPAVPPGYENLRYTVRIKGNGTPAQFYEIHEAVAATSPNFYNLSRQVALKPTLVVE